MLPKLLPNLSIFVKMKGTEHSAVGLYLESAETWMPPEPVSLACTKQHWLTCDGKLTGDTVGSHVAPIG